MENPVSRRQLSPTISRERNNAWFYVVQWSSGKETAARPTGPTGIAKAPEEVPIAAQLAAISAKVPGPQQWALQRLRLRQFRRGRAIQQCNVQTRPNIRLLRGEQLKIIYRKQQTVFSERKKLIRIQELDDGPSDRFRGRRFSTAVDISWLCRDFNCLVRLWPLERRLRAASGAKLRSVQRTGGGIQTNRCESVEIAQSWHRECVQQAPVGTDDLSACVQWPVGHAYADAKDNKCNGALLGQQESDSAERRHLRHRRDEEGLRRVPARIPRAARAWKDSVCLGCEQDAGRDSARLSFDMWYNHPVSETSRHFLYDSHRSGRRTCQHSELGAAGRTRAQRQVEKRQIGHVGRSHCSSYRSSPLASVTMMHPCTLRHFYTIFFYTRYFQWSIWIYIYFFEFEMHLSNKKELLKLWMSGVLIYMSPR